MRREPTGRAGLPGSPRRACGDSVSVRSFIRVPETNGTRVAQQNWFEQLPQNLLIGLEQGSLYALVALGYTLVYGIIDGGDYGLMVTQDFTD